MKYWVITLSKSYGFFSIDAASSFGVHLSACGIQWFMGDAAGRPLP